MLTDSHGKIAAPLAIAFCVAAIGCIYFWYTCTNHPTDLPPNQKARVLRVLCSLQKKLAIYKPHNRDIKRNGNLITINDSVTIAPNDDDIKAGRYHKTVFLDTAVISDYIKNFGKSLKYTPTIVMKLKPNKDVCGLTSGDFGTDSCGGTIISSKALLDDNNIEQTILHEAIHASTSDQIEDHEMHNAYNLWEMVVERSAWKLRLDL